MGIRLPSLIANAKHFNRLQSVLGRNHQTEAPKGHFVVYVGEKEKKRHVLPIAYLNHPTFQGLLCQAEEEFGYDHPMGGITIPCNEDTFVDITSQL